jgi:hypothetical protein
MFCARVRLLCAVIALLFCGYVAAQTTTPVQVAFSIPPSPWTVKPGDVVPITATITNNSAYTQYFITSNTPGGYVGCSPSPCSVPNSFTGIAAVFDPQYTSSGLNRINFQGWDAQGNPIAQGGLAPGAVWTGKVFDITIARTQLPGSYLIYFGLGWTDGRIGGPANQGAVTPNIIIDVVTSSRSGVLSHIAAGGGWSTVITLVNPSSAAVPVTVGFHNDDGSALSLPVTIGNSSTTTTTPVSATINANATLLITTGQLASTVVGWADVTSSGPVGGYAIFRSTPQTGSPSEGTVPLQSQFPSTITLPYDNTAGFVMGVALANLAATSANVTATIWDDSGSQLGTQTITIAGSGHTSFVLPNQLSLTAGKRGIVQFQSSGGLAGLGLRFSPFGTFTSVPTM